ncbi:TrbI/VirB10 family protein [Methylomonas sp. AM2-LC]|uniref:TrbI/VirB10 family protein n=1 Tax=Methylomonas sp. AM2-LC TaxID=3153301 RepID=UPI0032641D39
MTTNAAHEDLMNPDVSPNSVTSGVRRVNNVPLYIIGVAVLVFLIVMMMVAADRADQQNRPEEASKDKGGNASMFANQIAGDQGDGLIAEKTKPLEVPALSTTQTQPTPAFTLARAENLTAPPTPPNQLGARPQQQNDDATRIRQMKLQLLNEAIKAKTAVKIQSPRSSGSPPAMATAQSNGDDGIIQPASQQQSNIDPTVVYQNKLAKIQQSMNGGGSSGLSSSGFGGDSSPQLIRTGTSAGSNNTSSPSSNNDFSQFDKSGHHDRWKIESELEAPSSPYELRAGFVIPGTLISGINSELPGQIMAQVAQNVYDTATGKYLLIPQGARLVGAYSSQVAYGQARVLVAWQRIVFPDGKAMDIGAMPGADGAGYAGFNDLVDHHYLRIFGSALIMSAITAGVAMSQNQGSATTSGVYAPNASNVMSQALGQQLGHTTAMMIQKNLNIAPTLEIRPGFRFNLIITKDLTMTKPYQSFDY